MTIEKAIEQLEDLIKDRESFCHRDDFDDVFLQDIEALKVGISALEKQLPKKVLNLMLNADGKTTKVFKGICPCCQCIVTNEYCSRCGQALDWSDENA
jgi:hypothetical protein